MTVKRRRKPHRTDYSPLRIVWHKDVLKLLGKIPDTKLAKLMRVSVNPVRDERIRRGIPTSAPRARIDWTPERIDLLGKDTDKRVAESLGLRVGAVTLRRRVLGIPSYGRPARWRELSAREIAMLGKSPDRVVAKRIGLSHITIFVKRHELGIPPYVALPRVRWTKQMLALLARETDRAVAQEFGISVRTVARKRAELGLPPRWSGWVERTPALERDLARFRDHEVKKRFGIPLSTITRLREELGVPSPHPHRRWTDDQSRLLGTMPDRDVAKRIGVSKNTIAHKRNRLGIPAFVAPTRRALLSAAIAKRLGKEPDTSIDLGVSDGVVGSLRRRRGVKAWRRKWTPAEQALVGTAPDEDVAATLGIPRSRVKAQRESRRIPVFRRSVPA